jgi:streptogramin lyase
MKAMWLALGATLGLLVTGECTAQTSPPEIPFDSVPEFLHLPPNLYFGEVAGIAVNSKRHVFVLSRGNSSGPAYGAAATQLLEFGPDGRFLREIGRNLYAWSFAHAVRVDREDNIWVADKGSDLVVRFNPQGRVTMVFGRKAEASDESAHPLGHILGISGLGRAKQHNLARH